MLNLYDFEHLHRINVKAGLQMVTGAGSNQGAVDHCKGILIEMCKWQE